jgi:Tol biopolymer transport system component
VARSTLHRSRAAVAVAALVCSAAVAAGQVGAAAGDLLAVESNVAGGRDTEIVLVRSDGTVVRALTDNGFDDVDPGWSPDGRRNVFARAGARRGGIYTIDLAGRTVRRLTHGADTAPAFAPDGRRVAFVRGSAVRVLDSASGRVRTLAAVTWPPRQLSWTPDGRTIVFADDGFVKTVDVATARVATLPVGGPYGNFRPVLSPDGTTIAFLSVRDERYFRDPDAWGIFLADADGSNVRKLLVGKYGPTSWSRDGTRLAAQIGHELSVVDVATATRSVLLATGRNDHAVFAP